MIILTEAVELGYALTYEQAQLLAGSMTAEEATDLVALEKAIRRLGLKKAS